MLWRHCPAPVRRGAPSLIRSPWVWLLLAGLLGVSARPRPWPLFQSRPAQIPLCGATDLPPRTPADRRAAVLRPVRDGHRVIGAGGGNPERDGRCGVRPVLGHGAGVVRLDPRRNLGFPDRASRPARQVRRRWGKRLGAIEAGMARDGPFYLFGLRLIPVIPYFLVNLLMGLTRISTWTFYWISQLGMLPLQIVYVNAGTQLARLDSLPGICVAHFAGLVGTACRFPTAGARVRRADLRPAW